MTPFVRGVRVPNKRPAWGGVTTNLIVVRGPGLTRSKTEDLRCVTSRGDSSPSCSIHDDRFSPTSRVGEITTRLGVSGPIYGRERESTRTEACVRHPKRSQSTFRVRETPGSSRVVTFWIRGLPEGTGDFTRHTFDSVEITFLPVTHPECKLDGVSPRPSNGSCVRAPPPPGVSVWRSDLTLLDPNTGYPENG